jgi:hypothetical protein
MRLRPPYRSALEDGLGNATRGDQRTWRNLFGRYLVQILKRETNILSKALRSFP